MWEKGLVGSTALTNHGKLSLLTTHLGLHRPNIQVQTHHVEAAII